MYIRFFPDVRKSISRIARQSDSHLDEATMIFCYTRDLEDDLKHGRISIDTWNVRDSALGWLESCCTTRSGHSIWRLFYRQHEYAVALLAQVGRHICVLHVCGHEEVENAENALRSVTLTCDNLTHS
jgi:hypothetical protein